MLRRRNRLSKRGASTTVRRPSPGCQAMAEILTGKIWNDRASRPVPNSLGKQVVAENRVNCAEAVLPGDLFAFLVGAAAVRDTDFVDPAAGAGELRRDLGLETKTVLAQLHVF